MATIKDVARAAGVSVATVSRVANKDPGVREGVRRRVQAAMTDLDYKARGPRRGKQVKTSQIVGLVIPDITSPFFTLLVKGIEIMAKVLGYSVIINDSETDPEAEERHIRRLMEMSVSGIICTPTSAENRHLQEVVDESMPIVFLDRRPPGLNASCVTSSNRQGAYQAVRYLLSLGHEHIIHLGGSLELSSTKERGEGFEQALSEHGIRPSPEWILSCDCNWERSHAAVTAAIEGGTPRFTAIFSADDMMAYGAKQALEDKGLSVPKDASIIGFDDIYFSSLIGLTTIAQPAIEMGKNAMNVLAGHIRGTIHQPQQVVLQTSLIIRNSCMPRH